MSRTGPPRPASRARWAAIRALEGYGGPAFRVPSRTIPGRAYLVRWHAGYAHCNCRGAASLYRQCFHEKEILELTTALELRPEDAEALAPVPYQPPAAMRPLYPHPDELRAMTMIARNAPAAAGHAVPKGLTSGQAFAVMLAGWEIGIGPMTALRHITAINGRTEPDAQLMMGVCLANEPVRRNAQGEVVDPGIEFRWTELTDQAAALDLYRHGIKVLSVRYTSEDAQAAGQLVRPSRPTWARNSKPGSPPTGHEEFDGPWQTRKTLMLGYNAIKMACKLGAPDLVNRIVGALGAMNEAVAAYQVTAPESAWEGVGDLGGDPDFTAERRATPRPRPAADEWPDTPTPPGPAAPTAASRAKLMAQVKTELAAQSATPAQLAALVGGGNVSNIEAWLAEHPGFTVESMVRGARLGVEPETGEIPPEVPDDAIDGESREVEA